MVDKDFALAWQFVGHDGRPRQLRFRMNFAPAGDPRIFDGTGQLVATIADADRPDNFDEIAISRPDVPEAAVDAALEGWEDWALLHEADNGIDRWISLPAIQHRINAAGLGVNTDPPPNGE
ncbi:hypothetical protein [Mycobacterium sp. AT1]|uniref:hypothetical protein n=1 Tax=Mycobacterium sp. AT1 TaxID=1961706 RepID=UPI0009AD2F74|nr:hypothetical protein [Mycobacterium sp. AT1]OPX08357.1 hypothetical protein B1790_19895 [Mycobacterium sp. AT1]